MYVSFRRDLGIIISRQNHIRCTASLFGTRINHYSDKAKPCPYTAIHRTLQAQATQPTFVSIPISCMPVMAKSYSSTTSGINNVQRIHPRVKFYSVAPQSSSNVPALSIPRALHSTPTPNEHRLPLQYKPIIVPRTHHAMHRRMPHQSTA